MFKTNEKVDELSKVMCWFKNCPRDSCSAVNCETSWTAEKIIARCKTAMSSDGKITNLTQKDFEKFFKRIV